MGLSFRKKILIALVSLPILGLIIFCTLAVSTFVEDKTLTVNENNIFSLEQKSLVIVSRIKLLEGLVEQEQEFSKYMIKNLSIVQIWQSDKGDFFPKLEVEKKYSIDSENIFKILQKKSKSLEKIVFFQMRKKIYGLLSRRNKITLVDWSDLFTKTFTKVDYKDMILSDNKGSVLINTDPLNRENNINDILPGIIEKISEINHSQSSIEFTDSNNDSRLISYKFITNSNLLMFFSVDRWTTLRASLVFIIKAIAMIIFLSVISYLIAYFISYKMTKDLKLLEGKMQEVSSGNFEVKIPSGSKDEIGRLADKFRWLIGKMKFLILKREEHIYLEKDLEVAKTVQDLFFPQDTQKGLDIGVYAVTEMASRCGGDWWYYFQTKKDVYLFVGDATGHGVPAALMTSVVRSTLSSIDIAKISGVSEILTAMNKAVFEASKGKINMTMFICSINKETKKLTYSNASHDAPLIIKGDSKKEDKLWDKFDPLIMANGPRLGEKQFVEYTEESLILKENDKLLLYTDGVFELENSSGDSLTERAFFKKVLTAFEVSRGVKQKVDSLTTDLKQYHADKNYPDDWSLLLYFPKI